MNKSGVGRYFHSRKGLDSWLNHAWLYHGWLNHFRLELPWLHHLYRLTNWWHHWSLNWPWLIIDRLTLRWLTRKLRQSNPLWRIFYSLTQWLIRNSIVHRVWQACHPFLLTLVLLTVVQIVVLLHGILPLKSGCLSFFYNQTIFSATQWHCWII